MLADRLRLPAVRHPPFPLDAVELVQQVHVCALNSPRFGGGMAASVTLLHASNTLNDALAVFKSTGRNEGWVSMARWQAQRACKQANKKHAVARWHTLDILLCRKRAWGPMLISIRRP